MAETQKPTHRLVITDKHYVRKTTTRPLTSKNRPQPRGASSTATAMKKLPRIIYMSRLDRIYVTSMLLQMKHDEEQRRRQQPPSVLSRILDTIRRVIRKEKGTAC